MQGWIDMIAPQMPLLAGYYPPSVRCVVVPDAQKKYHRLIQINMLASSSGPDPQQYLQSLDTHSKKTVFFTGPFFCFFLVNLPVYSCKSIISFI